MSRAYKKHLREQRRIKTAKVIAWSLHVDLIDTFNVILRKNGYNEPFRYMQDNYYKAFMKAKPLTKTGWRKENLDKWLEYTETSKGRWACSRK